MRVKILKGKNKMEKKRKVNKNRTFYFLVSFIAIVVIVVTGVKVVFDFFISDDRPVLSKTTLENLDAYGYTLDDLDTDLYKTYFNELKDVLNGDEIDYSNYAVSLTKLFITDFYTLSNKVTSSDIGGIEFIHSSMVENFKMNAGDTMYKHVKNNVYGDRTQELPKVSNVTIDSVSEEEYSYDGNSYGAYKVVASWEYEVDLGYDSNGTFYLIKDNNKLELVEKLGE